MESKNYSVNIQRLDELKRNGLKMGFPFNEGFPTKYRGKHYEIILVSGEVMSATVNDMREWMSEGLEWDTKDGRKSESVVAGWRLDEPVIMTEISDTLDDFVQRGKDNVSEEEKNGLIKKMEFLSDIFKYMD